MGTFGGFPAGALKSTPLPNLFFSELLPQIESLAELKVTLHVFWLLYQKKGFPRCVTLRELSGDGPLLLGLKGLGRPPAESLADGLQRATARGTLLHLAAELGGVVQELYFLNTGQGREVVAKLRSAEIDLGQVVLDSKEGTAAVPEQPNVFTLYEQNIGLLTPLIAEELSEAEKLYPAPWVEDAFKQAVRYNRRNWNYVRRILERWAVEGKEDEENRGGSYRTRERSASYGRWRRAPGGK